MQKEKSSKPKKKKVEALRESVEEGTKQVEGVIEDLETDDRAHARELARMFKYLQRLRRKLEKECLEGSANRGVYALCHVLSQQREVIADIRSITDLSGQVELIDTNVLQPLIRTMGQQILNVYYQQRKLITEVSSKENTQFGLEKIEDITKEFSGILQNQYEQALSQVHKMFLGK